MDIGSVALLYDDDCGFCRWSAERIRAWDRSGRIRFVAIQSDEGQRLLTPVPEAERLDSMHAVTPDGRVHSAGAAGPVVLQVLPAGTSLAAVASRFPGVTEGIYRAVAHRRTTLGRLLGREACRVDPSRVRRV